jgi:hypothetical protein
MCKSNQYIYLLMFHYISIQIHSRAYYRSQVSLHLQSTCQAIYSSFIGVEVQISQLLYTIHHGLQTVLLQGITRIQASNNFAPSSTNKNVFTTNLLRIISHYSHNIIPKLNVKRFRSRRVFWSCGRFTAWSSWLTLCNLAGCCQVAGASPLGKEAESERKG